MNPWRRLPLWPPLYVYIVAVLTSTASCSRYPQAEVANARLAGQHALDAGADVYALNEFNRYSSSMNDSASLSRWNRLVQTAIQQSAREHRLVLVVNKYRHSLTAYKSGYLVAEYRVDLGSNALVRKRLQGDAATPEGTYHVTKKLGSGESKYDKALMINYPNTEDYRAFRLLQKRSCKPLRIGGGIGFQGGGGRGKDWTLGSIALENEAIDELFPYVAVGTPVVIVANETVQSERRHGGAQRTNF